MKQTDSSHYDFQRYMNLARWSCYYTQIGKVLSLNPDSVLEVGPGDGLFGWYMKKNGISYSSADHADDINSDFKVNLGEEDIPVEDNKFDVVCAFQVLEHIEFDKVPYAISELRRVSKKFVFLDIPEYSVHINFAFKIPFIKYFQSHLTIPRATKHSFDGLHHWEIGKKGFSRRVVRSVLTDKLDLVEEFTIYQNPKERFYLLKK